MTDLGACWVCYSSVERFFGDWLSIYLVVSSSLAGLLSDFLIIFTDGSIGSNSDRSANLLANLRTGAEHLHIQNNDDFLALHGVTLQPLDFDDAKFIKS